MSEPLKARVKRLLDMFKLTIEKWETIRVFQNDQCAICGKPPQPGRRLPFNGMRLKFYTMAWRNSVRVPISCPWIPKTGRRLKFSMAPRRRIALRNYVSPRRMPRKNFVGARVNLKSRMNSGLFKWKWFRMSPFFVHWRYPRMIFSQ